MRLERARARRAGWAGLRGGGACFGRGGHRAAQTAHGVSWPRTAAWRAHALARVLRRRLRPRAGKAAPGDRYPFGFHGRRRKRRKKGNGAPHPQNGGIGDSRCERYLGETGARFRGDLPPQGAGVGASVIGGLGSSMCRKRGGDCVSSGFLGRE